MNKLILRQQMLSLLQQVENSQDVVDMEKLHNEMMNIFRIREEDLKVNIFRKILGFLTDVLNAGRKMGWWKKDHDIQKRKRK